MTLQLAKAELIGTLLEAIFYGMYFVISLELFRLLYVKLRAGRRILYLLVTAVVIFSLITTHFVLQFNRIIEGFTDHMDVANAPVTYFNTISAQSRTAKTSINMTLTLVCDALFVYRVFVVYERKYVAIILPLMLFLADIALSAWSIRNISRINPQFVALSRANKRSDSFWAVTLALNLLCTVMVSWRIWASNRREPVPGVVGVRFMGVVAVILESAAIYSCVLIALIVTSAIGTNGMSIVFDSMVPIIGMVFSAVIVRASKGKHNNTDTSALPTTYTTDHTMSSGRQDSETVARNAAGDAATGHAAQIPSAWKRGSLTVHISTTPSQASYVDVIEIAHQSMEAVV